MLRANLIIFWLLYIHTPLISTEPGAGDEDKAFLGLRSSECDSKLKTEFMSQKR